MAVDDQLTELLLRWEEARSQGVSASPATLCVDCPELIPELTQRIRAVVAMEKILGVQRQDPRATVYEDLTPANSADLLPQVPGYRLERIVGQGGMGVVYEARQLDLGRTVGLKMLSGPHLGARMLARFRAEAEAAARLQHPNVLQIYEVGQVNSRPFFSMEYVAGGNLAQFLEQNRLTPTEAADLVETLARAVQHAHERGIVHRDLKPANVLLINPLRSKGEPLFPKIADFGLAKCLDEDSHHTQTGEILGTPAYMAPEQAEGNRAIGPGVDVYALGAILYECLTGQPPFLGTSPLDSLRKVTSEDPVPPSHRTPGVPADLEAICLKCLEKSPGQRYPSAHDLADDLRRFLTGHPVQARRAGLLHRTWKWLRRHPREVALAGVVLMLAAIPLISWWSEVQKTRELRRLAERQAPLAREILQRNCVECHDRETNTGKKNFDVLSHTQLLRLDRRIVVPGAPDDSRLIQRIADGSMPPEEDETRLPRLSENELTILRDWIRGGAPDFPPEDPRNPTPPVVASSPLASEVRDIFEKRCYECHKFDVARGGIKILHHRLLVTVRKVVIPGRPDESELYHLLRDPDDDRRMPPGAGKQIPDAEMETIRRWIEAGAPAFPRE